MKRKYNTPNLVRLGDIVTLPHNIIDREKPDYVLLKPSEKDVDGREQAVRWVPLNQTGR